MNEHFEATKKYILSLLPNIPNHITESWLLKALENDDFERWSFTFADLSNCTFGNISHEILRRLSISTYTLLPRVHPFNLDLKSYINKDIQELHNQGITGAGINVAVIDQGFPTVHDEFKECLKDYKDYQTNSHSFHGITVISSLAGKNLGVAPNANIYFYGIREAKQNLICEDTIKALKDIYERNINGENIRIVSISGYAHTLSSEFESIKENLKSQDCYIIDSPTFGKKLTCINERTIDGKTTYYYSEWQQEKPENLSFLKSRIAVPFSGVSPLWNTEHDYKIGGDTSYSWVIPRLSGIFALCLQLKPDMTLDELENLIVETKTVTEEGITIINPRGIIEKLAQEIEEYKKL